MNYSNTANSNCGAQIYLRKLKKHDQVKHLGLHISDQTTRFKLRATFIYKAKHKQ